MNRINTEKIYLKIDIAAGIFAEMESVSQRQKAGRRLAELT